MCRAHGFWRLVDPASRFYTMRQPGTMRLDETSCTANLRTKILDSRGFDSSTILKLWGGILRSTGDFPESLSQRIIVGIILVGRLGLHTTRGVTRLSSIRTELSPRQSTASIFPSICLSICLYISL